MRITDHTQTGIAQFLGIAPVQTVGKCVTDYGKILMTVGSDQRFGIGLSVGT